MANPNDPHSTDLLPHFIRRYVRFGDKVERIGGDDKVLLVRSAQGARTSPEILYTRIGPVLPPRQKADPTDWFVVAYVQGTGELKSILLSADAVRQHFYHASGQGHRTSLYEILSTDENTNLAGLRLAWRVKTVGACLSGDGGLKAKAERAFNLLANPDVRSAYVASLHDDEVPLPFPYGASGECVVAGRLSGDGTTFFAESILAFRPSIQTKRIEVLLRQCEFLPDRITFKDSKYKVELWLDAGLLEGMAWDSTWNQWKQWLRSRIAIQSDFVEVPKVHFEDGEKAVTSWWIALPSRTSVVVPESLSEDIERARAFHYLSGHHAEILGRVREQVAREPVEVGTIQFWFDELGTAPKLRPEVATWQPDYDEYYFDQLRQRARVWFLFRDEYLFVLPGAVVSEIPMAGHASYIFAEPADLDRFLLHYSGVVRSDIRSNKANVATELGFVGRVVRGTKKRRWLADVLKHCGPPVKPIDIETEKGEAE